MVVLTVLGGRDLTATAQDVGAPLSVAVIVDLRLAPFHTPDGSAEPDHVALNQVLDVARVLIERPEAPVTVDINTETFDALELIGDDASLTILRDAVRGRPLIAAPWTSLNIAAWTGSGHSDVLLDGLRRSAATLEWVGAQVGRAMRVEQPVAAETLRAVAGSDAGVEAFIASPVGDRSAPVILLVEPSGVEYPLIQPDRSITTALQQPDPAGALAELSGLDGVVVVSVPALTVAAETLAGFLDQITADASTSLVTVEALLARQPPVAAIAVTSSQHPDTDDASHTSHWIRTDQRLRAYESMIGDTEPGTADLHTLLAVAASSDLSVARRGEFLDTVDARINRHATGVELLPRDRVTVTERFTDLPVTVLNSRPTAVTVALKVTSDEITTPAAQPLTYRLEPGRNDLAVPIEVSAAGTAEVQVAVTTPDPAAAITLDELTLDVRYAPVRGVGSLILVICAAMLALWWLRARRRGARAGATVAATQSAPPCAPP